MAKNILVISCESAETRVALIENGIIAELHIERRHDESRGGTVGDIFLGKVTRVLPGLQAAFIDIGLERAAFLHVEDLIRPDDFEAYLQGGRKHALGTGTSENGQETPAEEDAAAAEAEEEAVAVAAEQVEAEQAGGPPAAAAADDAHEAAHDATPDDAPDAPPAEPAPVRATADVDVDGDVDGDGDGDGDDAPHDDTH